MQTRKQEKWQERLQKSVPHVNCFFGTEVIPAAESSEHSFQSGSSFKCSNKYLYFTQLILKHHQHQRSPSVVKHLKTFEKNFSNVGVACTLATQRRLWKIKGNSSPPDIGQELVTTQSEAKAMSESMDFEGLLRSLPLLCVLPMLPAVKNRIQNQIEYTRALQMAGLEREPFPTEPRPQREMRLETLQLSTIDLSADEEVWA